jgi:uncharacterized protein
VTLRRWPAAVLLALAATGGCRAPAPVNETADATSNRGTVVVEVAAGGQVHRFQTELARTEAEQAEGLMHRASMAPDAAMLFPFAQPRVASFWMENTAIPLDMIFIRADGSIARIADNTVPFSREPVLSNEPVVAVLELAGGRAAEIGLSEGDHVAWPGGPRLPAGGGSR